MAANNPNNKKRLKRSLKIYEVNIKHIRLMIKTTQMMQKQ